MTLRGRRFVVVGRRMVWVSPARRVVKGKGLRPSTEADPPLGRGSGRGSGLRSGCEHREGSSYLAPRRRAKAGGASGSDAAAPPHGSRWGRGPGLCRSCARLPLYNLRVGATGPQLRVAGEAAARPRHTGGNDSARVASPLPSRRRRRRDCCLRRRSGHACSRGGLLAARAAGIAASAAVTTSMGTIHRFMVPPFRRAGARDPRLGWHRDRGAAEMVRKVHLRNRCHRRLVALQRQGDESTAGLRFARAGVILGA